VTFALRWLCARRAAHRTVRVRYKAASDPRCPPAILAKLSWDQDVGIRLAVATHLDCPLTALDQLSDDPDREVRRQVAGHPHCTPGILAQLAQNAEQYIVAGGMGYFNMMTDTGVREAVASNLNTPPDILRQLSCLQPLELPDNPDAPVTAMDVAGRSFTVACKHVWQPEVQRIVLKVAANHNTPPGTLTSMLSSNNPKIVQAALSNPSLPRHVLAMWQLASQGSDVCSPV